MGVYLKRTIIRYLQSVSGLLIILSAIPAVNAQVALDGTLGGIARTLPGPDFVINPEHGLQIGPNLFHSFSRFDLNKAQSATFNGTDNIQNIIGRITSAETSVIDGLVSSKIPKANLYLLNPAGFLIGSNAQLNVSGNLHISTASQIEFQDDGVFDAVTPENSTLSSAPPVAFGFFHSPPASIQVQESQLSTPESGTLTLSAAEVDIDAGVLESISGRINLIGIGTDNRLLETADNLLVADSERLGNVRLHNNSIIDVGKQGEGDIYIRSGRFEQRDSQMLANAGAGNGGVIRIDTDSFLLDNASIDSQGLGPGQGGSIVIQARDEAVLENSAMVTTSLSSAPDAGDAGNISLSAGCARLLNSTVSSETLGAGNGGNININTMLDINLVADAGQKNVIQASSRQNTASAGDAGKITLSARNLNIAGEVKIDDSTFGGAGGSITLLVADKLNLSGGVTISADSNGAGKAGSINITAARLKLADSSISTAASQSVGGNLLISVLNAFSLDNSQISATVSSGQGNGGNIIIGSPDNPILNNSLISADASIGNGGLILIFSGQPVVLKGNSKITAASEGGNDGDVKIDILGLDTNSLPTEFLDASVLIQKSCAARVDDELGSFFILVGHSGLPSAPGDLQSYVLPPSIIQQQ